MVNLPAPARTAAALVLALTLQVAIWEYAPGPDGRRAHLSQRGRSRGKRYTTQESTATTPNLGGSAS